MNTNKTLADVQPGGRVRLGDGQNQCKGCGRRTFHNFPQGDICLHCNLISDECRSTERVALDALVAAGHVDQARVDQALKVAAALSAQPSPGGQGDALELLACFLNEPKYDLDMDHEISLHTAVGAIAFALAARQPVGSVPEWFELVIRDVCELDPEDPDAADTVCIRLLDLRLIMERHALPAQAVDLEELRRAVCVVGVVGQIDGHDVVRRNSVLDVIDTRRQRLADSQAVGK